MFYVIFVCVTSGSFSSWKVVSKHHLRENKKVSRREALSHLVTQYTSAVLHLASATLMKFIREGFYSALDVTFSLSFTPFIPLHLLVLSEFCLFIRSFWSLLHTRCTVWFACVTRIFPLIFSSHVSTHSSLVLNHMSLCFLSSWHLIHWSNREGQFLLIRSFFFVDKSGLHFGPSHWVIFSLSTVTRVKYWVKSLMATDSLTWYSVIPHSWFPIPDAWTKH